MGGLKERPLSPDEQMASKPVNLYGGLFKPASSAIVPVMHTGYGECAEAAEPTINTRPRLPTKIKDPREVGLGELRNATKLYALMKNTLGGLEKRSPCAEPDVIWNPRRIPRPPQGSTITGTLCTRADGSTCTLLD